MLAQNGNGWASWYGRGLTARDIAAMLKPYGVRTVNVKVEREVRKGYRRDHLYPVFDCYLTPPGTEVAEVADTMEKALFS